MQFKDLPEYAKQAACNALSGRIIKSPYSKDEAKEIRDAFIALYSEPENAGAYENLDSVAKEATESFFSQKYSECGEHKGFIFLGPAIEEGKEPVIIDKNELVAAHKTNDGVIITLRSTDKQLHMSGDAEMLMDQLRKELGKESRFKNMFVFAPKGIEGLTTKAISHKQYSEAHEECARLIRHQLDLAIDEQRARQDWEALLPTINLGVLAHVLAEQLNGVGRKAIKYSK
ncbi:hypothetical protein [Serratia marcescens]|uniref:hypothetical protein n=1 Tax=Serratia marcescens TaxID=615 RepID=UPI0040461502